MSKKQPNYKKALIEACKYLGNGSQCMSLICQNNDKVKCIKCWEQYFLKVVE